jgi:hypothetical protein
MKGVNALIRTCGDGNRNSTTYAGTTLDFGAEKRPTRYGTVLFGDRQRDSG